MDGGERRPKDAVPCDGKSSSLSSIPVPPGETDKPPRFSITGEETWG